MLPNKKKNKNLFLNFEEKESLSQEIQNEKKYKG